MSEQISLKEEGGFYSEDRNSGLTSENRNPRFTFENHNAELTAATVQPGGEPSSVSGGKSQQKLEEVILVDEQDIPVGTMEKMEAHEKALLHRAFSVFILNGKGEMLLQQRAAHKYHSAGLWTNACCSHPRPGEATVDAAYRRLQEELGFKAPLQKMFDFTYRSAFENGLTEHEFDHVFMGYYDGPIYPNKEEVSDYSWSPLPEIRSDLATHPKMFTSWFHLAFPLVEQWLGEKQR